MTARRLICWPHPDATCLQGGCTYCPDGKWKTEMQVRDYATTIDQLDAFEYGRRNGLYREGR